MQKRILLLLLILILTLPLALKAGLIDDLKEEIKQKQEEVKKLEAQVNQLKENIKTKQTQKSALQNQIDFLENQILKLSIEIKLTLQKISQTNLQIQELNLQIQTKQNEIEKQKENIGEALQIIYEYDQENFLSLILKNNNFSEFLDQVHYLETLQEQLKGQLEGISLLKSDLETQKQETQDYQDSLKELQEDLKGKNSVLLDQKEEKDDLLRITKNQEKQYQAMLNELQKKREEIQKEIFELEAKLQRAIDPNSIPGAQKGLMDWPLKGRITQGYGATSETGFVNNVYNFHNGIDVSADIGTPVRAALEGKVIAAGNNGKYAYGKWLAVDHNNGLITLYAHLSAYNVSVGQTVKRGSIIAYSGNTGFSTGPHLHFTVYAASTFQTSQRWYGLLPLGGSVNPMNYL